MQDLITDGRSAIIDFQEELGEFRSAVGRRFANRIACPA
jgi:hypothetical protein